MAKMVAGLGARLCEPLLFTHLYGQQVAYLSSTVTIAGTWNGGKASCHGVRAHRLGDVQPKNLELLKEHPFKVLVFCGANQVRIQLAAAAARMQELGTKACYIEMSGNARLVFRGGGNPFAESICGAAKTSTMKTDLVREGFQRITDSTWHDNKIRLCSLGQSEFRSCFHAEEKEKSGVVFKI